jgi:lipopolysaccharide transport system ATP-binding protein
VGLYRTVCTIPGNFLNDGMYRITVLIVRGGSRTAARADEVVSFTVHDTGAMRKEYTGPWIGSIRPRLDWDTEQLSADVSATPVEPQPVGDGFEAPEAPVAPAAPQPVGGKERGS